MCLLRREPIDLQVAAARRRLEMVPEELRLPRVHPALWPPGQRWCAGCQSFVDLVDCGSYARCHPCRSSQAHGSYVERTYGIDAEQYRSLLTAQGHRCAICGNRPVTERLAVDHDHRTGKVRGLLCSRCNHDLLGAAHDSVEVLRRAVAYLEKAEPADLVAAELPSSASRKANGTVVLPAVREARALGVEELGALWAFLQSDAAKAPF